MPAISSATAHTTKPHNAASLIATSAERLGSALYRRSVAEAAVLGVYINASIAQEAVEIWKAERHLRDVVSSTNEPSRKDGGGLRLEA